MAKPKVSVTQESVLIMVRGLAYCRYPFSTPASEGSQVYRSGDMFRATPADAARLCRPDGPIKPICTVVNEEALDAETTARIGVATAPRNETPQA